MTKNQNIKKVSKKKRTTRTRMLQGCPQKRGTCIKIFITTPKKPNSASRKTVKVLLLSTKKKVICHVPGIKHNLQKYSNVLVQGAKVRDLPGVKYRVVRGKFDLMPMYLRATSRSKYGVKKFD